MTTIKGVVGKLLAKGLCRLFWPHRQPFFHRCAVERVDSDPPCSQRSICSKQRLKTRVIDYLVRRIVASTDQTVNPKELIFNRRVLLALACGLDICLNNGQVINVNRCNYRLGHVVQLNFDRHIRRARHSQPLKNQIHSKANENELWTELGKRVKCWLWTTNKFACVFFWELLLDCLKCKFGANFN